MIQTSFGISVINEQPSELFPLLEIEPADQIMPSTQIIQSKLLIRFSHWYLLANERSEQNERESMLFELYRVRRAIAATVSVPSQLQLKSDLELQIQSLLDGAKTRGTNLYFDFGQAGPPEWMDANQCVSDPLWFRGKAWSPYWRIHGWHPERWVRLYSKEDLRFLAQLASELKPRYVILGHSQRAKQWGDLQNELRTLADGVVL